jgi:hypothetical protein
MVDLLMGMVLFLLLVALVVACALSYRKHTRRAKARSRAALNRLLAEADEIAQAHAHEDATSEVPSPPDPQSGGEPTA